MEQPKPPFTRLTADEVAELLAIPFDPERREIHDGTLEAVRRGIMEAITDADGELYFRVTEEFARSVREEDGDIGKS